MRFRNVFNIFWLLLVMVCCMKPNAAQADDFDESDLYEPPEPVENVSDSVIHVREGFFLRMKPGFGFAGIWDRGQAVESLRMFDCSGKKEECTDDIYDGSLSAKDSQLIVIGPSMSLSLGGSFQPDTALHADLGVAFYSGYDSNPSNFRQFTHFSFGIGTTHYFNPNFYITAGARGLFTSYSLANRRGGFLDGPEHYLHMWRAGMGATAEVGREFSISENWGFGVELALTYNVLFSTLTSKYSDESFLSFRPSYETLELKTGRFQTHHLGVGLNVSFTYF